MAKKELTPEQKEAKKLKRLERKKKKEEENTTVVDNESQTFINKKGKAISLIEFLKPTEVWKIEVKRKDEEGNTTITKKAIITYDGIKRLAKEAGIYYSEKKTVYSPTIDNRETHAFDVTIYCHAGTDKNHEECYHGHCKTTMLGEASSLNTKGIGSNYKGTTAEKRGYIRAVINHLGLVDMLGEDEMEEPSEIIKDDEIGLPRDQFEQLTGPLNAILNLSSMKDFDKLMEVIAEEKAKYTPSQLNYLREVSRKKRSALQEMNF